jgi:DNA-binding response OmpR family regulator
LASPFANAEHNRARDPGWTARKDVVSVPRPFSGSPTASQDIRQEINKKKELRVSAEITPMRILLVEDNVDLSLFLRKALNKAGYDVDDVTTAGEARCVLFTTFYAALVLDLGLPDADGLSLLRALRQNDRWLPVLIVTARAGIADRVLGLRAGAEDYLVKPFAIEELVARVQGLLRRGEKGQSLKLGNLELIIDQHGSQAFIDGQSQNLSARDNSILEALLRKSGRVVSKSMLVSHLASDASEVSSNAIEVYVHRLRKALEDRGATASIVTVRGVGYIMNETQQPRPASPPP